MSLDVVKKSAEVNSRPLYKSDPPSRLALAHHLNTLVIHFDQADSVDSPAVRPLATISAGLSVVLRLLDGSEDEVTTDVRRQTLSSFAQVIKRHTLTEDLNGVEHTANVIFTRLKDLDRSVRLSSG